MAEATTLPLWLWGAVGGAVAEVLRWYQMRETLYEGMPHWAADWKYWVVTVLMIGVGSVLVLMHQDSGTQMTSTLAVNVGASAPLFVSALLSKAPEVQHVEPPRHGMAAEEGQEE